MLPYRVLASSAPTVVDSASAQETTPARTPFPRTGNGIEAGAHDFIAKPFRQEKLIDLLCAHLELQPVYVCAGADPAEQSITPPVIPPAERLQGLLALAQRGDVQNLLLRIEELQLLDRTYAAFAAQARTLAESYRMQELRRWLERCRAIPNECSAA